MVYEQIAIDFGRIYDTRAPLILGMYSRGMLRTPAVLLGSRRRLGTETRPGMVVLDGKRLIEQRLSVFYGIQRDQIFRESLCLRFRHCWSLADRCSAGVEKKLKQAILPPADYVARLFSDVVDLFALDFVGKFAFPFDHLYFVLAQLDTGIPVEQLLASLSVPTVLPHQMKLHEEFDLLMDSVKAARKTNDISICREESIGAYAEQYGYLETFDIEPAPAENPHVLSARMASRSRRPVGTKLRWTSIHQTALRRRELATGSLLAAHKRKWGQCGLIELRSLLALHRCIVNHEEIKRYMQQRALKNLRGIAHQLGLSPRSGTIEQILAGLRGAPSHSALLKATDSRSPLPSRPRFSRPRGLWLKHSPRSLQRLAVLREDSHIHIGSKAATLAILKQKGFPVPDGVVLKIAKIHDGTMFLQRSQLRALAGDAVSSIHAPVVAVRSSFSAEDGTRASLAGQAKSFLGLWRLQDIAQAIQVTAYSLSLHSDSPCIPDAGMQGAILIQGMVDATKSGILADTTYQGRSAMMIEAVPGLNMDVTSGDSMNMDRIIMDRHGHILRHDKTRHATASVLCRTGSARWSIGDCRVLPFGGKRRHLRLIGIQEGGGVALGLFRSSLHGPCLEDKEVVEIGSLAGSVRRFLGYPLDMEWAIDRQGKIQLLQVRPLTRPLLYEEKSGGRGGAVLAYGLGVSPGKAEGRPRIWRDGGGRPPKPGEIVVAHRVLAPQVPCLAQAAGLVLETGGYLSHTSIVARELGIPCVAGVENATNLLRDIPWIMLDGMSGQLRRGGRQRPGAAAGVIEREKGN